jgi:hypothetical protein
MNWTEVFIDGERLRGLNWLSGPWSTRSPDLPPVIRAETVVKVRPGLPHRPGVLADAPAGTTIRAQVKIWRAGKIYFSGPAVVEFAGESVDFLTVGRPDSLTTYYLIRPIYGPAEPLEISKQGESR